MIRVGFSTTSRWISRLIRWFTDSEVSHTFLVYDDLLLGQPMVLDVAFRGFQVLPLEQFKIHNKIIEIVDVDVDLEPGLRVVARWLGRPYDWRALVSFSKWFRSLKSHPAENPKAIICTEAVVHALRISGYPGAEALDAKGTTPKALRVFLRRGLR